MDCKIGLYVLDKKGRIVPLSKAQSNQTYYCRLCHRHVYLRGGVYNQTHFAHKRLAYKHSHDFSQHQFLQQEFGVILQELNIPFRLEYNYFKNLRADIIFKKYKQYYIVEVQRSPISYQDIDKRIQYYLSKQIPILWVLLKSQKEEKLTLWQQYLIVMQQCILFYDEKTKSYSLLQSCYKITRKKVVYQKQNIYLKNFLREYPHYVSMPINYFKQRNQFLFYLKKWQINYQANSKKRDVLSLLLYQSQKELSQLKQSYYTAEFPLINFKESCYWAQTVLLLLSMNSGFSSKQIVLFCQQKQLLLCNESTKEIFVYLSWVKRQEKK